MVMAIKKGFGRAVLSFIFVAMLSSCGIDEILSPKTEDSTPTASIVTDTINVPVGSQVTLDGSSSESPNGEALTYAWAIVETPSGSTATLGAVNTVVTTFVIDRGGYYTVTLQVTNESSDVSEVVKVRVSGVGTDSNHPPVSIAGDAQTVTVGDVAVLDGSLSYDADGDSLTYSWTLISAPATSAITTVSSSASMYGLLYPDVAGDYTVRLTVSDFIDSSQAFITVTAE